MDKSPVTYSTVGLDMSLTGTGFALASGPVYQLMTIKTKPKDFNTPFDRLRHISDAVMSRIAKTVRLVCIEDYFVPQTKAQFGSAINLIALGTVMRMALYEAGIPFIIVAPSQLKKFVTGKGTCQKSMILREVYKRWEVDAKDDNQADAFGLAKMAEGIAKVIDGDKSLHKYQLEVIDKVLQDRPAFNFENAL